jgi:hypothetical protein
MILPNVMIQTILVNVIFKSVIQLNVMASTVSLMLSKVIKYNFKNASEIGIPGPML